MDQKQEKVYVNTEMPEDLRDKLDVLKNQSGFPSRSSVIRFLIIREWDRRNVSETSESKMIIQ